MKTNIKKKLKIINLASGSSGNATFISDGKIKILIDIGISYKELLNKERKLNINLQNIDYIFITHSHSDHIKGLKTYLTNNKNTKICSTKNILYEVVDYISKNEYEKNHFKKDLKENLNLDNGSEENLESNLNFNKKSRENLKSKFQDSLYDNFYVIEKINKEINIGNITLTPYKAYHDTECIYYIIDAYNIKFGILTDCGHIDDKIIKSLKNVNYLMIESNYDEDLIDDSIYPRFLINRIKGKYGHLSNADAAELINKIDNENKKFKNSKNKKSGVKKSEVDNLRNIKIKNAKTNTLQLVCLSHISKNSNSEENALKKVKSLLKNKNIKIITASRLSETIIY